jgi:hypothetical protein
MKNIKFLFLVIIFSFVGCKKQADPGGNGDHYPGAQVPGVETPNDGYSSGLSTNYYLIKENYYCSNGAKNINSYFQLINNVNSLNKYSIFGDFCTNTKNGEVSIKDKSIIKSKTINEFPILIAFNNNIYEKRGISIPLNYETEKYILSWCYDSEHTVYIEKNVNKNNGKIYYSGFDGWNQIRDITLEKKNEGFVFQSNDLITTGEINLNKSECKVNFDGLEILLKAYINK